MSDPWSWAHRRRTIRIIVVAAWCIYVIVGLSVALLRWPLLLNYPFLFLVVIAAFVVPPAWIHIAWVHFPGYLFVSNGIRRLYVSGLVQAQVSEKGNRGNPFGVPALPVELRTLAAGPSLANRDVIDEKVISVRVMWDEYLLVSSSIMWPGRPLRQTTQRARLDISADAVSLRAGRWRPGIVLQLPVASIVGVWDGSEIATIDSRRVLVLVVDSGQGHVLFPFEILRGKNQPRSNSVVEELMRVVNRRRVASRSKYER